MKIPHRYEGFSAGLAPFEDAVRIFPHNMDGEGHFAALLQKGGCCADHDSGKGKKAASKRSALSEATSEFLQPLAKAKCFSGDGEWMFKDERLYYVPRQPVTSKKLRFLRTGLLVGECKKNRFEPSQALAMALLPEEFPLSLSLPACDERTIRYLKGETIDAPEMGNKKGWLLVCTDGYPLGFGKLDRGRIKNKYNAGWRML